MKLSSRALVRSLVSEEVLGRLKEDTRRRKERQFNNQSEKANGSTEHQIPRETDDSVWHFLLMVLFREEEELSNHFKTIPATPRAPR